MCFALGASSGVVAWALALAPALINMAVRSRFDADDFGNDKMPERYGGVGRFADAVAQTDGVATSMDDLQAWDSDEDMELED